MTEGIVALQRTRARRARIPSAYVLVAEDDVLIADHLGELVRDAGHLVLGPVGSVADALDLLRARMPDAALLDYGLSDGPAVRVAEALRVSGVPYALSTGVGLCDLPDELAAAPRLAKPFGAEEVERVLRELLNNDRS